MEMGY